MIVFLLPLLGQGPALSIWGTRDKERNARREERRKGKRRTGPRGVRGREGEREGGSTCELSLLGEVSWAGAAGDTHQGGCDLGVTAVYIQVAAGQG